MASELAYMVANTTLTTGRTFEKLVFNDKNPTRNPVTGETLDADAVPQHVAGFLRDAAGRPLPTLNLEPRLHHHRARAPARRASPSSTACAA